MMENVLIPNIHTATIRYVTSESTVELSFDNITKFQRESGGGFRIVSNNQLHFVPGGWDDIDVNEECQKEGSLD
jgi:hypothetical protein